MKNYFLIFVFAIFAASCLAQQSTKKIERVKTTNNDSIDQQRLINLTRGSTFKAFDAIIRDRHDAVNHPVKASLLNGRYVRSFIGINLDTISKLSDHFPLYFKKAPADSFFIYEGKRFQSIENYICPDYNPRLISLWDITKMYTKGIPVDKCLFMVDEYLLTTDLDEFKFDDSYIDKVVVSSPKEIQSLKKGKYFDLYLVHIFTKSRKSKRRQGLVTYSDSDNLSDLNFANLRVDLGVPKDGNGHTPVYFAAGNLIMEYGSNGDTPPLDNTGDGKVGHIADHAKGEYLAMNKNHNYDVSYADTERDLFGWGDITGRKTSQGSEVLNYYPSATPPDCICSDMKYDIARSALGGSWRLPSYNEIVWLKENCTWTWKDAGQYAQDAPAGYLVIGCSDISKTYDGADHSGSSIFLPTSGSRLGSSVGQRGNNGGSYWSGTISKKASTAYCLRFYSGAKDIRDSERYIGFAVRPVAE